MLQLYLHESGPCFKVQFTGCYVMTRGLSFAVMKTYRCTFNFVMLIHIMMSFSNVHNTEQLVAVSFFIQALSIAGKISS